MNAITNPKDRPVKISCRNVWKIYGERPATFFAERNGKVPDPVATLKAARDSKHIAAAADVSFDVHAGEIMFDGKDLLRASRQELTEIRRRKMGMVFQNFGLMPHLNVIDNVAFPLKVQGLAPEQRLKRAAEMVELVGLKGREANFPSQLSGGQQQRVGIARSLAVEPELWFLDEPFSALDPLIRRQMQDEFLRLQKILHKTIVFITHDFLEALRIGDRIAIMKDGEVVQIGTPSEVVMHPATDYVAEFTKDVPRVKVITAGDCMVPATDVHIGGTVPLHLTLDNVLPQFVGGASILACIDETGSVCGHITAGTVLAALAASEKAAA